MDNFKEIAEKCLSGELSGVFILRNGCRVHSSQLKRDPLAAGEYRYIMNGLYIRNDGRTYINIPSGYDIVDFISNSMREIKEIKIEVPEGYEIDKDNSIFEKIVFKKIEDRYPKSWEELCKVKMDCYNIINNVVYKCPRSTGLFIDDKVSYPTRELAGASLALSQLLQFRAAWIHQWSLDNGLSEDWKPDWKEDLTKYCISMDDEQSYIKYEYHTIRTLSFPDKVLAYKFLDTFKDLIEQAKDLI